MITFNQITKRYAGGHEALSSVDLHIQQGEMAFLTGHSGAGKSTMLKLIAMLERPSSGQIIVQDKQLNHIKGQKVSEYRSSIGVVFQAPMLLDDKTVFENVALPLKILAYPQAQLIRRVHAALDMVGLLKKVSLLPSQLSAGEQQRVGIARAVVHRPMLLLADEPTGNLDPKLSEEIMILFTQFNNAGMTMLIATHDLSLIAGMKNRIIRLKEGRLC